MTTTPDRSEIRAATFLAAQARLDAPGLSRSGKTRRNVKCTPPNKLCGNRCIPPNWDCRLKGEGTDNHLRAATTDPVGGAASIERGVRRIIKGVKKGSVAEVDAGRRAIVRGVVKATPGNIQDKKEKQKELLKRTGLIVGITAAVAGGIAAHRGLANIPFYRDRVYQPFNKAAFDTFSRAMDTGENTVMGVVRRFDPSALGPRENTRLRGRQSAASIAQSLRHTNSVGPASMLAQIERPGAPLPRTISTTTSYSAAVSSHITEEVRFAQNTPGVTRQEWLRESTRKLFDIRVKDRFGKPTNRIVYSGDATKEFLADTFSLRDRSNISRLSTDHAVVRALADQIQDQSSALQTLAAQRGVDLTRQRTRRAFANSVLTESGVRLPDSMRSDAVDTVERYLLFQNRTEVINGEAKRVYNDTLSQFDKFYARTADELKLDTKLEGSARNRAQLLQDAEYAHARHVAAVMNSRLTVPGSSAGVVVNKAFFNTKVRGVNSFAITDREALTAAADWSGQKVTSIAEAFRIIQRQPGLEYAVPGKESKIRLWERQQLANPSGRQYYDLSGINFNKTVTIKNVTRRETRAQAVSSLERVQGLDKQRIYGSRGSAETAYDQAHLRGDALPPRVRSFLEVQRRLDFQTAAQHTGKPCGRSFIPKGHKCGETTGSSGAAPSQREPSQPSAPESSTRSKVKTAAAVIAVTGAAALTAGSLFVYKNRSTLVPNLSQQAIQGLSAKQVKQAIAKLPENFRDPVSRLVGDAKLGAAHMALKAQGAQIRAVDIDNNFSTWSTPSGGHISVGSVGDSLLTFGAERKADVGKFQQFGLGFTVDTKYDAATDIPSKQAKQLIKTTKAMYSAQLDMLPDDAFLFAVPHKADGKGGKRKSIYEKMGFKALPNLKGDKLWALKNQGKFTEIPDNQFEYIGNMIRGDAEDELPPRVRMFLAAKRHYQAAKCPA
jgi:hypothetical protein